LINILQAKLAVTETPQKIEHLNRLDELKKRLGALEKQVHSVETMRENYFLYLARLQI